MQGSSIVGDRENNKCYIMYSETLSLLTSCVMYINLNEVICFLISLPWNTDFPISNNY